MAVYTEVSDEEVRDFVAGYDIGAVSAFKGIAEGVENSNYLLQTERGSFILTLYEKRVADKDLPFFLGLMDHLAGKDFPSPQPVHAKDGMALRSLCGRPAAIVSFLNGMWPRRITPDHCRALGAAAARLHIAGEGFGLTRPNNLSVAGWRALYRTVAERADEVAPGLAAEIGDELTAIEADWPRDLPSGIIHADLFPDNVFFLDGTLSGVIDFYFACNDFFVYEMAVCLNAWCFEPDGSFNVTKARALLSGYRAARPLSTREIEALPVLARGGALRFLLTRLYDWLNHPEGAFVKPKDPLEYLGKLRFHRDVGGPGGYGIDP